MKIENHYGASYIYPWLLLSSHFFASKIQMINSTYVQTPDKSFFTEFEFTQQFGCSTKIQIWGWKSQGWIKLVPKSSSSSCQPWGIRKRGEEKYST